MSSRMRGEKKSLLVPTKSHTKNEKQIREQIQYEVEWENDSDKRRSKLSGFPHSTHSFTDLLLSPILTPYFYFFFLGSSFLHYLTSHLQMLGIHFHYPEKLREKTEKRMRGSKRSTVTSAHTFDRESVILMTVGSSALPLKVQRE